VKKLSITALLMAAAASAAIAGPAQDARAVFDRYMALGEAFDPAVAQLYTDDAVIKGLIRYPNGTERGLKMSGAQWKKMVDAVIPLAKANNDISEYKDVRVEDIGGAIRISARRYSRVKCYWDPNHYMVLRKQPDGSMKITEEYMETQQHSDC